MSNYSLSILIPARNEQFLKNTVEDILKNKRGKTEIIVGLDGEWSDPGLPQHPDVQVLKVPDPIGQRAMVNQLCRLSKAKYVMKLDAHCAVDEGFDVKMMAEMKEDYTMVPKMYNLHVFDWVCTKCGNRRYQGKKGKCEKCGGEEIKDMVWKPRWSRENTAMRFDKNMRFAYWGAYKKYQQGDVVETMSILGACFMLTREGFWELEICDEDHGSWGQQGTEVACKTWLSGRKLMCNKKTWFAHLFRTQGDDFGFPYDNPGTEIEKARAYSKDLWLNDRWPKAKYKLSWLINKFNPPEWNETKGIVYYTDSQLDQKIETAVQEQLRGAAQGKRIISVSLKPSSFG
jgi:ribosomal protein L37E